MINVSFVFQLSLYLLVLPKSAGSEYDIRGDRDSGSANRRTANREPMASSIARGPVVHPCIAPEPHAGGKCTKRSRHPKSRDTNAL